MNNGKIIAFDGPDGVGKSTQLQLAAEYLRSSGYAVHTTRASGGTPIGELLRSVSLSDTMRHPEVDLYISLAMHTELGYDLQQRKHTSHVVLVDRSPLAIIGYQSHGSQLPRPEDGYDACLKMLRLWQLDQLFVFQAPQDVLDDRRQSRHKADPNQSNDFYERKDSDYHARVQFGYRQGTKFLESHAVPGLETVTIDASSEIERIHKSVVSRLVLT